MITVRMSGGLGNQMFQFAAGFSLSLRHRTALQLDAADLVKNTGCTYREYGLGVFKLVTHNRRDRSLGVTRKILDRLSLKLGSLRREKSMKFDPDFHQFKNDTVLDGYWQSPTYFENCESQLRDAFSWKNALPKRWDSFMEEFQGCPIASIHFRRGDYASNPNAAAIHGGICDEEYYTVAIARLRQSVPGIRFAVFSDEPDWVKSHRKDLEGEFFVRGNADSDAHVDMRLMSMCNHHVIANSTFSWWGAWLNNSQEKRVIAPRRWFADGRAIDILPKSWEAI